MKELENAAVSLFTQPSLCCNFLEHTIYARLLMQLTKTLVAVNLQSHRLSLSMTPSRLVTLSQANVLGLL